jgi:alcohol dehydrogenase (cytochrome c)
VANYPPRVIATDKETGKVKWETSLADGQADVQLIAAALAVKDKIILGAAGGDRDFVVALDAATGKLVWRKYTVPAPGDSRSAKAALVNTPELRQLRSQTMLFVFGL